jgi:2-dehydropantoate 2-reductase
MSIYQVSRRSTAAGRIYGGRHEHSRCGVSSQSPAFLPRGGRFSFCQPTFYRSITTRTSPQVYILGLGSIGTFAAHTLADIPERPAINLLLHRPSLLDGYIQSEQKLRLATREGQSVLHTGYGLEVLRESQWYSVDPDAYAPDVAGIQDYAQSPVDDTISDLIVCVKSTQTVAALRPLLPRLSRTSNIMFLQNGAGMIEDVNTHLWPNPSIRPNYITGVISHGVTLNKSFNITHTGPAATAIGPVPRDDHTTQPPSYMLNALPLAPRLNCKTYDWQTTLCIQLEKLACNAFSNPLCALADAPTSYLFSVPETLHSLMQEISSVVLALPELHGVPGLQERFSAKALERTVMDIVEKNKAGTTSMVWDMRWGRETEVRYINGYWAMRGKELGVITALNAELVERVEKMSRERMWELKDSGRASNHVRG